MQWRVHCFTKRCIYLEGKNGSNLSVFKSYWKINKNVNKILKRQKDRLKDKFNLQTSLNPKCLFSAKIGAENF